MVPGQRIIKYRAVGREDEARPSDVKMPRGPVARRESRSRTRGLLDYPSQSNICLCSFGVMESAALALVGSSCV